MSTTTVSNDMTIDEALQEVNDKYDTKISESDSEIQGMIDDHDKLIGSQMADWDNWKTDQIKQQNDLHDFTIQQIEEQKEQAEKDYIKEQSGAYKDWQKQSDKYGVNAEQMASSGMKGSGYSESSQVAMYNQYQSRVTTAREVFNRSIIAYDNSMTEARLQNSSILAEIAYNALVAQNELALTGLQYNNNLILEKANRKLELESMRDEEWYEILKQMNVGGGTTFDKQPTDGPDTTDESSDEYPVNTEYYHGNKNPDAEKYGTFKNGYQPKGISGHGKLEKTGDDITFETVTLKGEKKTVKQNIWEAEDYSKWYWDGRENKYKLYMPDKDVVHQTIQTEYYEGLINPDAAIYGTFSNGYQPKGIFGVGLLEKSGAKKTFETVTLKGEKKTVTQNVWVATDGSHWYWDGKKNEYRPYEY